ncbi:MULTISPECIES: methionyl-tRNA formyltransferase [unclassified Streptomyces]|uniref:methionyl-tRNA formyltransferase n=2 Tax=unclassified Streptomyces TaxID=2593676 RepID=UPI002DD9A77B|nr:methionyl-tRNA formyltransferase [Streptomyces sp. NBC_01237]WRZ70338.1 methionyl-tRNA formyltransferase [Streptomyces sp. NBC_01237]
MLFSEVNSKLGAPFLDMLHGHPLVDLAALVTSPVGRLCDYFVADTEQVDLEQRGKNLGVPVLRPEKVNDPAFVQQIRDLEPDYLIVGNFQRILKSELLAAPKVTSVNFHPSALPRYAGLAPFYWMVRNGETDGAVTAIEMAEGLDTGAILTQHRTPLTGRETALELRTMQERANVLMLLDLIPQLAARRFLRIPQDSSERTYFTRPGEDDYRLDFAHSAHKVACHIRAGYRNPGAFAETASGERVTVLSADDVLPAATALLEPAGTVRHLADGVFVACRDGWLRLLTVELDGTEVPVQAHPAIADGQLLSATQLQAA